MLTPSTYLLDSSHNYRLVSKKDALYIKISSHKLLFLDCQVEPVGFWRGTLTKNWRQIINAANPLAKLGYGSPTEFISRIPLLD